MPAVIDPNAYIIGAAEVYYRAVATAGPWTYVGATIDDVIFRINQTFFNPSEDFNGLLERVRLMDYLAKQSGEAEFTMLEVAGTKLAISVPGVTTSVASAADAGGTPFSSTLAAAAAIGATNIKVVAVTNLVAGDYIRINVAGVLAEYRQVTAVGTAGAGGTGVDFRDPLLKAHLSGVAAVESVADGKTVVVPGSVRRIPLTSYYDFALVAQSPTDYYELILRNAISQTESAELTFGNESAAGIRVNIATRRDGAALATPSWELRVPA